MRISIDSSYLEFAVEVSGDFQPYEAQTHSHPGCDSDIENIQVLLYKYNKSGSINITSALSPVQLDEIRIELLESIED